MGTTQRRRPAFARLAPLELLTMRPHLRRAPLALPAGTRRPPGKPHAPIVQVATTEPVRGEHHSRGLAPERASLARSPTLLYLVSCEQRLQLPSDTIPVVPVFRHWSNGVHQLPGRPVPSQHRPIQLHVMPAWLLHVLDRNNVVHVLVRCWDLFRRRCKRVHCLRSFHVLRCRGFCLYFLFGRILHLDDRK